MDLPEEVKLVTVTAENLGRLWTNIAQFPQIWPNGQPNQDYFLATMAAKDSIYLEYPDHGILYLNDIEPGRWAEAHVCFWDRKLKGKEEVVKKCLRWAFITFDLQRISTGAPQFAKATMRFIERIGMKKEGTVRRGHFYKGEFIDRHEYGILREELENGQVKE